MFGFTSVAWAVSYETKTKIVYYLSLVDDEGAKIVWTKRRQNARRFSTESEAQQCIDLIKAKRANKKRQLKTAQV